MLEDSFVMLFGLIILAGVIYLFESADRKYGRKTGSLREEVERRANEQQVDQNWRKKDDEPWYRD
jgi:hypothetical protein